MFPIHFLQFKSFLQQEIQPDSDGKLDVNISPLFLHIQLKVVHLMQVLHKVSIHIYLLTFPQLMFYYQLLLYILIFDEQTLLFLQVHQGIMLIFYPLTFIQELIHLIQRGHDIEDIFSDQCIQQILQYILYKNNACIFSIIQGHSRESSIWSNNDLHEFSFAFRFLLNKFNILLLNSFTIFLQLRCQQLQFYKHQTINPYLLNQSQFCSVQILNRDKLRQILQNFFSKLFLCRFGMFPIQFSQAQSAWLRGIQSGLDEKLDVNILQFFLHKLTKEALLEQVQHKKSIRIYFCFIFLILLLYYLPSNYIQVDGVQILLFLQFSQGKILLFNVLAILKVLNQLKQRDLYIRDIFSDLCIQSILLYKFDKNNVHIFLTLQDHRRESSIQNSNDLHLFLFAWTQSLNLFLIKNVCYYFIQSIQYIKDFFQEFNFSQLTNSRKLIIIIKIKQGKQNNFYQINFTLKNIFEALNILDSNIEQNINQKYLKMEEQTTQQKAKVLRVIMTPSVLFHLKDSKTGTVFKLALNINENSKTFGLYHLLRELTDSQIKYQINTTNNEKVRLQTGETYTGNIYLKDKNILTLLDQQSNQQVVQQCHDENVYEKDEIVQCYVMKVECLKLILFLLEQKKSITFYFTEFRLPKISNYHPKQIWHKCQQYFKEQMQGTFVQVKINGSETYRDELNIYGEICQLNNGNDLKQKFLADGYVDISKNWETYLTKIQYNKYQGIIKESKNDRNGIWKEESIIIGKLNNPIVQEQKYSRWEEWNKKNIKFADLKNNQFQFKQILAQLRKNSGAKADPSKNRIIIQTILSLLEDSINEKNFVLLEEVIKICTNILSNLQMSIGLQVENLDFLKYLNKILIVFIFYIQENQKLIKNNRKNITKGLETEVQKSVKIIFKCCFIGNQTFHKKVFHKNTDPDFQRFSYDPAYLSGISSYSEQSDFEEAEKTTRTNKLHKKIASGQVKIRMNSTLLLGMIFKKYSSIVQNHWQICINSNVLTQDFNTYLHKLKITIQATKMTPQDKKRIAALMRTNFGDYSIILLIFFQQNAKVKVNALHCIINMIENFQGKKMIDTTQAVYIQKLLKQTKLSFVPKSYIIFSGLRNILYFMLFSLHHEKNILIIMNTFKALTQLCQKSTLIDKMGFIEGMGLLLSNYITPVLQFSWEIEELLELKMLCVSFLGSLVSTQKKWEQVQNQYLMREGQKNINYCFIQVLEGKKKQYATNKKGIEGDKLVIQICNYFTKMAKRYYSAIFFNIIGDKSIWTSISQLFMDNVTSMFTTMVEEFFKCHFDYVTQIKSQGISSRKVIQGVQKAENLYGEFLTEFFPKYSQIVTNQNYISLINILTYISYDKWNEKGYETAKQFLLHCFYSVNGKPQHKIYPSIQTIKSNSLVRLALIKLLGYMSFCKVFYQPEFSSLAVQNLLKYSKSYKSLNSVVKITWGISNWSNIECFKEGLTEEQLKECLDYMVLHSRSDKQKIASNCTRGIGFFMKNFHKHFDVNKCREAIVKNLSHQIIKVRTNSTRTLRAMIADKSLVIDQGKQNDAFHELVSILQQNILKNNYHLQTETLLLIKQLGSPIKPQKMLSIYGYILKNLSNHTTMEYEFSEIKTLKQLRRSAIDQIASMNSHEYLRNNQMVSKQFYQAVQNFILDQHYESLRKKAHESSILQRGFEKGQEAQNAVFNIKKQKYDEEQTITTQFTLNALQYQVDNEEDLELLRSIKTVAISMQNLGDQWQYLAHMVIQGKQITLGKA